MKTGDYIYKGIFALSLLCVAAVLAVGIHYGWRASWQTPLSCRRTPCNPP